MVGHGYAALGTTSLKGRDAWSGEVPSSLHAVMQNAPGIRILTDLSGRVLASAPDRGWCGVGSDLTLAIPEAFREPLQGALERSRSTNSGEVLEVPVSTDGAIRWFQVSLIPHAMDDARPALLWLLLDITSRRREHERLRRSEEILVDTQGVAHLGTWDWDPRETYATWSKDLYRIYGLDPEQHAPTYEDYLKRVHPDDRARVQAVTDGVFRNHQPYSHDERIFRPDGSMRWLHTWAQAVKDEHGNLIRLVGVCQDITERKLAELEIVERLKEKEVLLKEIHHRVKNNLQVIVSLLQMQAEAGASGQLHDALIEARGRVRSMALVHETLYQNDDLSQIDLASYIGTLSRDLLSVHSEGAALIKLSVEAEGTSLDMDRAINCGLVVNELLSNALKHAFPDGQLGSVRIVVTRDEERISVTVEDDGVGMDPRLFETSAHTLGLNLVGALARQLGGTVTVHSNGGTRVCLAFPHSR